VRYTAGYAVVPPAIEEACAEWVAELWKQASRDPALVHLSVTGVSSQFAHEPMPARVKGLLAPYRPLIA
jgi:hypothetical protein